MTEQPQSTQNDRQNTNSDGSKNHLVAPKNIVIFGATSAIAQAVAVEHARLGYGIYIIGRNQHKLDDIQNNLQVVGAPKVQSFCLDLNTFAEHETLINTIHQQVGQFDRIIFAQGTLPENSESAQSYANSLQSIQDNCLNTISLATPLANILANQKYGNMAFISSVAGDRGRQSNYIYGASKAMITTFAAGLRNRLYPSQVHIMTVKPGFVDTPMTAGLQKGALWAQPEDVATAIMKGFDSRQNTLYTPWFWRYIMLIIMHIPEFIFKRLKL